MLLRVQDIRRRDFLAFLPALAGTVCLGYFVEQGDFGYIVMAYALLWAFYGYALKAGRGAALPWFVVAAFLLRLALLPTYPPLSDDYFRFVWDGYMNNEGISPYLYQPQDFMEMPHAPHYDSIYESLNSKIYYSVYPPLLQAVFTVATWLSPNNLLLAVILMKLVLVLSEALSVLLILKILRKLSLPDWQVLLYALNPLVIVEISGNLHFEGMMICFLLASIYLLLSNRLWWSAASLGLAVGAKLLPLMFVPLLIRKIPFRHFVLYGLLVAGVGGLSFFMLWDLQLFLHFGESLRLYYASFEFNGGLYFVLRKLGYLVRGYNEIGTIGPALAGLAGLGILVMSLFGGRKDLNSIPLLFLFALTMYQLCSTTVHPWYIAPLVALASLTRFRYPILWSGLILLTYINYSYSEYHENIWVVALEYFLVIGLLIWELSREGK